MKRVKIAFTGSQRGMSLAQRELLEEFLRQNKPVAFIHGGCVGADDMADEVAAKLGIHRMVFPGHIPEKRIPERRLRARGPVTIMPPENTLKRNPKIVASADLLVACPKERLEVVRSGTWTTVRIARRQKKPTRILLP